MTPTFQFDFSISLGVVIECLVIVGTVGSAYIGAKQQLALQLAKLEATLNQHAESIKVHSTRMEKYEQQMSTVSGHLQRLIGRAETMDKFIARQDPQRMA